VHQQHFGDEFAVDLRHEGFYTLRRRERDDGIIPDIDAGGAPVLIAVVFLEEYDVAVGVRPAIERCDIAIGDASDSPRGGKVVDPCHEQVANAVDRCEPGQVPAIRADSQAAVVEIIGQRTTGYEFGHSRIGALRPPKTYSRGKRRSGFQNEPTIDGGREHAKSPWRMIKQLISRNLGRTLISNHSGRSLPREDYYKLVPFKIGRFT